MPVSQTEAESFAPHAPANDNHAVRAGGFPHVCHIDDVSLESGSSEAYGGATWRTLICRDKVNTSDMVLGIAEIPANGVLAAHRHPPAEFYLVLDGSGQVTIDGVSHDVGQRSVIFIPGNAEHSFAAGPLGVSFAYGFAENAFSDVNYTFSQQF